MADPCGHDHGPDLEGAEERVTIRFLRLKDGTSLAVVAMDDDLDVEKVIDDALHVLTAHRDVVAAAVREQQERRARARRAGSQN